MRKIFIITVLLVLNSALIAQMPSVRGDANPAAEAEIKALELRLAELIVKGDWDQYAKYLASDYVHTRDNGHVESQDEVLTNLRRQAQGHRHGDGAGSRNPHLRRHGRLQR
jgi:hypothetical protein